MSRDTHNNTCIYAPLRPRRGITGIFAGFALFSDVPHRGGGPIITIGGSSPDMMRRVEFRVAGAALAAWLAVAAAQAVEPGSPVPAVGALPLGASGPAIELHALRGKVVYVDFWASWCVPCRLSMPRLDALHRKHSARGFIVVGVNKDAALADAERFLKRVPVGFLLAQDGDDALAKAFDVKAMPSGYLIDRRGVVRRVHRGFTGETAAALEREVEQLLAEPS